MADVAVADKEIIRKLDQLNSEVKETRRWVAVASDADNIFPLLFQIINVLNGLASELALANSKINTLENKINAIEERKSYELY